MSNENNVARRHQTGVRNLAVVGLLLLQGVVFGQSGKEIDPAHPLAKALEKAYSAREALNDVNSYEAVFTKKELVNRKLITQSMQLKMREKPFSVYLKFQKPLNEGREVLYVEGKNKGNLVARDTGLAGMVGALDLPPTGTMAMADNRYPLTMIGLRKMVDTVITQWEAESKFGECDVNFFPEAKFGDVECLAISSTHPQPRKQFKFHKTMLYIDKTTNFPFRVEQYDFPARAGQQPPIIEEYTYTKIRANPGLAEIDFDRNNPKYSFR